METLYLDKAETVFLLESPFYHVLGLSQSVHSVHHVVPSSVEEFHDSSDLRGAYPVAYSFVSSFQSPLLFP